MKVEKTEKKGEGEKKKEKTKKKPRTAGNQIRKF